MPEGIPSSVGIVGLGVMGGSLARSLAEAAPDTRVLAYTPDPGEGRAAVEEGVVERTVARLGDLVSQVDLLVYAAPLEAVVTLLGPDEPGWPDGLLVTDVASLQRPVLQAAERGGRGTRFVASHPMAGSHLTGFGSSRADLYRGATVWLSVGAAEGEGGDPLERITQFWRALGARPQLVDAAAHDRAMTRVSHLPQILSTILANRLEDEGVAPGQLGPGGRDATRLASSAASIWLGILREAREDLAPLLREVADDLLEVAAALEAGDWDSVERRMDRARAWKERP